MLPSLEGCSSACVLARTDTKVCRADDLYGLVRTMPFTNPCTHRNHCTAPITPLQAMKDRTTPTATLSMSLPFDEYSVWTQNAEYVRKALDLPGSLTVIKTDDARFGDAATAKEIDPAGKAKDVTPMDPDIHAYAKQA